ncbi:MAG: NAD(P)H-hydrate dehydratase, partial [Saprospiraceae bacterium]
VRNELQRKKAQELDVIIILKGAHTCIATPTGDCYFNSTGNPGMGTAGTGDVLTGILTGLLAQGYNSQTAAILGVYLHGLAGDIAQEKLEQESLLASDLIEHLGMAFRTAKGKN